LSLIRHCASQDTDILQGIDTICNKLDDLKKGLEELKQEQQQGQEAIKQGQSGLQKGQEDIKQGQSGLQQGQEDIKQGQSGLQQGQEDIKQGQSGLQQGQEAIKQGQKEILKGIQDLHKPSPSSSADVDLYSIKLKEAITMQTDLLPRRIDQSRLPLKTDDIFTNLTVYQGKQKSLHEKAEKSQCARKTVTEITEIFVSGENEEENPKSILISGEPGIGKTLFSHKIVRDWSTDCISIPNIKFTYLITFRQLVMLGNKELTLRELLNRSPLLNERTMIDEKVMTHIAQHSDQLFIIFDGYDEYKDHNELLGDFEKQFENDTKTKMPVAALISKVIQRKILRDSVIIITSRPGEADELDKKLHFNRCVEITGFSEEQVLQYVEKYFNSKPEEVKKMAMEK
ncbi:NACHT, LRR and PYD domains-containing protein 12, partial [Exaiptasia diaphana]|uniref:NACHT domain-containing protein n=1 Tax=Exaiptasia diaphana TaxID=2652724 RepID=A0A913X0L8_EXADI